MSCIPSSITKELLLLLGVVAVSFVEPVVLTIEAIVSFAEGIGSVVEGIFSFVKSFFKEDRSVFLAVIFGPLLGVGFAHLGLRSNLRYRRRLDLLQGLTTYRIDLEHPDFVKAFNMLRIEFRKSRIEFRKSRKVENLHQEFRKAYSSKASEEVQREIASNLVARVAKKLGIRIKASDFAGELYLPSGWKPRDPFQEESSAALAEGEPPLGKGDHNDDSVPNAPSFPKRPNPNPTKQQGD